MSRVLPAVIRSRHGAYLGRWYREHEQRHNDGVNRLVVRFAREGVAVVAGWRGEVNVPGLTQVRPDLLTPAERVPSMPGGPAINGAGPPLVVLRDVRRYSAPPQVRHAVPGVVAFVSAQRSGMKAPSPGLLQQFRHNIPLRRTCRSGGL